MVGKPRGVRVPGVVWEAARDRIEALEQPLRVTVTIWPGDNRNAVIEKFLKAIAETEEKP